MQLRSQAFCLIVFVRGPRNSNGRRETSAGTTGYCSQRDGGGILLRESSLASRQLGTSGLWRRVGVYACMLVCSCVKPEERQCNRRLADIGEGAEWNGHAIPAVCAATASLRFLDLRALFSGSEMCCRLRARALPPCCLHTCACRMQDADTLVMHAHARARWMSEWGALGILRRWQAGGLAVDRGTVRGVRESS
jgi:hypothetical protein